MERHREGVLPFAGSLPISLPWPGLGQAENTSWELHEGLLHGCRDPSTWAICCCFPQCIGRELHWEWSSRDLNQCPAAKCQSASDVLLATPQDWSPNFFFTIELSSLCIWILTSYHKCMDCPYVLLAYQLSSLCCLLLKSSIIPSSFL